MKFTKINTLTGLINKIKSSLNKETIGLGNVDNTSDINKPISTATQTALDGKADKTAIIPNNDSSVGGYCDSATWYRVAEFETNVSVYSQGALCNSCEIVIYRDFSNTSNEYHHLYFSGIFYNRNFNSISNISNVQYIDKIRFCVIDNKAYIDIHHSGYYGNNVNIKILNGNNRGVLWKAIFSKLDDVDISDQVVYDIPANSELAQKSDLDDKADKTEIVPYNQSGFTGLLVDTGWYRIAEYDGTSVQYEAGNDANSVDITLKRSYSNEPNEYHRFSLISIFGNSEFISLSNKSLIQRITKIRHIVDTSNHKSYIDIYYNGLPNYLSVTLSDCVTKFSKWQAKFEYIGAAEISSQTMYNIPANSEVAQKSDVYLNKTLLASDDLNNITDNAIYMMKTTPASGKNYPVQLPGTLFNTNDGSNYIRQVYIASTANDTRVYIRNRAKTSSTSYTWSSWVRLATTT